MIYRIISARGVLLGEYGDDFWAAWDALKRYPPSTKLYGDDALLATRVPRAPGAAKEGIVKAIREWQEHVHATAVAKGWYDNGPRNVGEQLALIHSEISEALEEYRRGRPLTETYHEESGKPAGFPVELADAVIRIMDLCGAHGIDLEAAIEMKDAYNQSRPYRHGGKVA